MICGQFRPADRLEHLPVITAGAYQTNGHQLGSWILSNEIKITAKLGTLQFT